MKFCVRTLAETLLHVSNRILQLLPQNGAYCIRNGQMINYILEVNINDNAAENVICNGMFRTFKKFKYKP
jgi:hypothetical protein